MTFTLDGMMGAHLKERDVTLNQDQLPEYVRQLGQKMQIPHVLFLSTTALTFAAMMVLTRLLPDFYLRTAIWMRALGHNTLRTIGIEHMPTDGPVLLLTNCHVFPAVLDLIAGVDRYPQVVLVEKGPPVNSWLRRLARRSKMISVPAVAGAGEWNRALEPGLEALRQGEMIALNVNQPECAGDVARLIAAWCAAAPGVVVLPVCCTAAMAAAGRNPVVATPYPRVIFGQSVSPQTPIASIVTTIDELVASPDDE